MADKPKRRRAGETPALQRVRIAQTRRVGLGSALAHVQEKFIPKGSINEFLEWRNHPLTLLMIDALRELSATPPVGYVDTEDIGAQYGVSSGLSLAANFFGDPMVLFPHLFSGAAPGDAPELPEADYSVSPDDVRV